jgi:hypothetical protein
VNNLLLTESNFPICPPQETLPAVKNKVYNTLKIKTVCGDRPLQEEPITLILEYSESFSDFLKIFFRFFFQNSMGRLFIIKEKL